MKVGDGLSTSWHVGVREKGGGRGGDNDVVLEKC